MLTVPALLAVLLVLFGAAVVATRDGDVLREAPRDAADLGLPAGPLQPEDIARVRFGLALRGYRMSEVDELLDRTAHELAARDARIVELEQEAWHRAQAAAALLEQQAAATPPLGGRGVFLGVRNRTRPTGEAAPQRDDG